MIKAVFFFFFFFFPFVSVNRWSFGLCFCCVLGGFLFFSFFLIDNILWIMGPLSEAKEGVKRDPSN